MKLTPIYSTTPTSCESGISFPVFVCVIGAALLSAGLGLGMVIGWAASQ